SDAGRRDATRKRRLGLFHEERRGHQKSRKIAFRSAETTVVNPDHVGHALWKRRQWLHSPERGSRLTARRSGGRRSRRPRDGLQMPGDVTQLGKGGWAFSTKRGVAIRKAARLLSDLLKLR